ncbi:hypothetical protein KUV74_12275 [Halomonas sp. DP1Y21-3]|uniref:hypothetical protein n=1 Tax=Halomonas sp. DP1Y21-3 TaxID=2859080 RepID=UPI001C9377D4|nr:hypothetical protein [Halomonas sp. DP1Y21-3]MBY6111169.1 hypothetical protein [Halomonas sp. DP1Y21-3]
MSSSIEALQQRLEQVEEHNCELAHDLEAERHHRRAAERGRDALAAHQSDLVRELTSCQSILHSMAHYGSVTPEYADDAKAVLSRTKEASLARRDATKKAEALHEFLMFPRMGDEPVRAKAVKLRDGYRQQAEGGGDE